MEHTQGKSLLPEWIRVMGTVIAVAVKSAPLLLVFGIVAELLVGISIPVGSLGLGLLADGLGSGLRETAFAGIALLAAAVGFQWILGGLGARFRLGLMERTGFHFEQRLVGAVATLQTLDLFNQVAFQNALFQARDQVARAGNAINIIINALSSFVRSGFTIGVLVLLDPRWALLVLAAGLMVWSSVKAAMLAEQAQLQGAQQQRQARQLADAVMNVHTAAQVRIWQAAPALRRVVDALYRGYVSGVKGAAWKALALRLATSIAYMGCFAALVLVSVRDGALGIGALVTLIVLGSQLSGILYGLSQTAGALRGGMDAIRRVQEVEAAITEFAAADSDASAMPLATSLPEPTDGTDAAAIRFDGVGFAYGAMDGARALQDIDLTLRPGEVVGIVGDNGAGKSTFVSLLLGTLRPGSGRLDGAATKSRSTLLQQYLRPELQLRDAIGMGSAAATWTDAEVRSAISDAGVEGGLGTLAEAPDTMLGTPWGGRDLSGGQWQQVALARALMRPAADVLVMDEPTAAISPDREYDMLQALRALTHKVRAGRRQIAVLVSHRLSLMKDVDRILVFRDGRIVEDGSHAALMALPGGHYRHQFEQQSSCYA